MIQVFFGFYLDRVFVRSYQALKAANHELGIVFNITENVKMHQYPRKTLLTVSLLLDRVPLKQENETGEVCHTQHKLWQKAEMRERKSSIIYI